MHALGIAPRAPWRGYHRRAGLSGNPLPGPSSPRVPRATSGWALSNTSPRAGIRRRSGGCRTMSWIGTIPGRRRGAAPSALLQVIAQRQAALVSSWMQVGFVHGVMNTDTWRFRRDHRFRALCGSSGPMTLRPCSGSIDELGRYAFGNQARAAHGTSPGRRSAASAHRPRPQTRHRTRPASDHRVPDLGTNTSGSPEMRSKLGLELAQDATWS